MNDEFKLALAENFAWRLNQAFRPPPTIQKTPGSFEIKIRGRLSLGSNEMATRSAALCRVIVDDQWIDKPPVVTCEESWIRKGVSWHISPEGVLCWEYNEYWRNEVARVVELATHGQAAEFGTIWLVRSVRNLLNRHLFAYRTGIKEWRPEWNFWAHGRSAAKEYFDSIQPRH